MENPYAPPKEIDTPIASAETDAESELSREGNLIVCADNTIWPDRCVVCNTPVSGAKTTRRLFWHASWIYALVLVSWILYLIVALIVRKKGVIHISVCEQHRKRRISGILIATLGSLGCLGVLIVGASMTSGGAAGGILAVAAIVGILACLIAGIIMARTVAPMKIADNTLWIKAGKAFTDSI